MNEKDYNLLCYNFQQKIINIFNQEQLPFLVKFFLLKQVWKIIKKHKKQNDYETYSFKTRKIEKISLDKEEKQEEQE